MSVIEGSVAPGFEPVRDAFELNFAERAEVGAGLAVRRNGQPVVDLWGGLADPDRGTPWRQDTIATLASTTKAMAVIATLMLVDQGKLELDRPMADYWPEFAAEGKDRITLRMVLAHSSGVVSLEHQPLTYESMAALTPVFDALASATPQWEPGTAHGYHGLTIGHLLSRVIQSVTGQTVGPYFAEQVAKPLDLDCYIGLPESELPRLASMVVPQDVDQVALGSQVPELVALYQALGDPTSLTYRATYGSLRIGWESANDHRYAMLEAPSSDGVASASGLAKLFAATIGEVDGIRLFGPELAGRAGTTESSGTDQVLNIRSDWGLGFMLPGGPLSPSALPPGSFGHGGATGSYAFADPNHGLSFGYVPNRGSELLEGNDLRVASLVDSLYRCVG